MKLRPGPDLTWHLLLLKKEFKGSGPGLKGLGPGYGTLAFQTERGSKGFIFVFVCLKQENLATTSVNPREKIFVGNEFACSFSF